MRRPCSVSTRVASEPVAPDLRIERHEQPHVVPGDGQLPAKARSRRRQGRRSWRAEPLRMRWRRSMSFTAAGILASRFPLVALRQVSNSNAPRTHIPHSHRAAAGVSWRRRVHGRPAVLAPRVSIAAARRRCLPTRGQSSAPRSRRPRAVTRGTRESPAPAIDALVVEEAANRARRRRVARLVSPVPRHAGRRALFPHR